MNYAIEMLQRELRLRKRLVIANTKACLYEGVNPETHQPILWDKNIIQEIEKALTVLNESQSAAGN